jgi:allantoinase
MPLLPDRLVYSPIIDRPHFKWPNDARVAFWVAPNVEFYEYLPDSDGVRTASRRPWPWTHSPRRNYPYLVR